MMSRSLAAFAVLQGLFLAAPRVVSSPTAGPTPDSCLACSAACDDQACHRIAMSLAAARDYARAIAVEEKVLARDPRNPEVAAALAGMHQMGTHDTVRAIKLYHEALYSAPGYPAALLGLGTMMQDKGELQIAERYFSRGVREHPDQPLFKVRLAEVMLLGGRTDEAQPILREVIAKWPGSNEADRAGRMIAHTSLARP